MATEPVSFFAPFVPEAPPSSKPNRGAPPGNQNARKHGFYSDALSPKEQELLYKAINLHNLLPEIALMRVKLLRLISYPDVPPDLLIRITRTLTRMFDVQLRLNNTRPRNKSLSPGPRRIHPP